MYDESDRAAGTPSSFLDASRLPGKDDQKGTPAFKAEQNNHYLFKWLLLVNIAMYLEAGAIPALLVDLTNEFKMNQFTQGLMGGIVYLLLSVGGPIAGVLLKVYPPRNVLAVSLVLNNLSTLGFALTPSGDCRTLVMWRGAVGFTQVVLCIYSPVWCDEFSPPKFRTTWMSYLQGSVPFGIMLGYVLATASLWLQSTSPTSTCLGGISCWRLPFLVQVLLVTPLAASLFFVPHHHVNIASERLSFAKGGRNSTAVIGPTAPSSLIVGAATVAADTGIFKPLGASSSATTDDKSVIPLNASLPLPPTTPARLTRLAAGGASLAPDETLPFFTPHSGSFVRSPDDRAAAKSSSSSSSSNDNTKSPSSSRWERLTSSRSVRRGLSASLYSPYRSASALHAEYSSEEDVSELDEECSPSSFVDVSTSWKSTVYGSSLEGGAYRGVSFMPPQDDAALRRPKVLFGNDVSTSRLSDAVSPHAPDEAASLLPHRERRRTSTSDGLLDAREEDIDRYLFGTRAVNPAAKMAGYLFTLLGMPVFVCLIFALASLYFVVTGVQFWGTAYLQSVLHGSQYQASMLFITCSATGPTLGVFFGGYLIDRIGGYKGRAQRMKTMTTCAYLGTLSCLFGFPATYVDDVYAFSAMLWLMLFFGAAVLPGCTGVAVSVVPRPLRSVGGSVSLVVFNLFGYSLSLILSGALMQAFNYYIPDCDYDCSLRLGFRVIVFWGAWAFLLLLCAIFFSRNKTQTKVLYL